MPHSFAKIVLHVVYGTKGRRPWLTPVVRKDLIAYTISILGANRCSVLAINGTADHMHCLMVMSKTIALSTIMKEIKRSTSRWLKTQSPALRYFAWQGGYGAFSVSESVIPRIVEYIENQEEHHRKYTAKEEFQLFLERHNIYFEQHWLEEDE